jgi:hypothetical protein
MEFFPHTVECKGASSGTIFTGTYSLFFPTPGTFPFHCAFHNSMQGIIVVLPPSAPLQPTVSPTTAAPVLVDATGDPTAEPSPQPPTAPPSVNLAPHLSNPLTYPAVLRSGHDTPAAWNLTIYVRADRVRTSVVSFNARLYCYQDPSDRSQSDSVVCSLPGPTLVLTPGDNLTLLFINELQGGSSTDGKCTDSDLPCTASLKSLLHQPLMQQAR